MNYDEIFESIADNFSLFYTQSISKAPILIFANKRECMRGA
jgi:hypothetical protein